MFASIVNAFLSEFDAADVKSRCNMKTIGRKKVNFIYIETNLISGSIS